MFKIKTSDRVFIAGQTGSGKTEWCKTQLWNAKNLIIIDAKNQLGDWNCELVTERNLEQFMRGKPKRLRVVPSIGSIKQIGNEIDEYLKKAYQRRNCIVYIDEIYSLANTNNASDYLVALLTRGRGLGIGLWTVSQRPHGLPLICMSEAQYYACFRLKMPQDRTRMAAFMGNEILRYNPKNYEYYFYQDGSDKPVLINGMRKE